jgi:hypothetical protein
MTAALDAALGLAADAIRVFPCRTDKTPACPKGFKAATRDADAVRELWKRFPGELVGVPTGTITGFDVLDIDGPRHPEAKQWWRNNHGNLPVTRIHRSRSGGVHVLFTHAPGLRCWAARPVPGVDGRADGGYVVWWPGFGGDVVCGTAPTPWPAWLLAAAAPLSPVQCAPWNPPALRDGGSRAERYAPAALRLAAQRVATTPAGYRNSTLNSEAFGLGRLIATGDLNLQQAADTLAGAATAAGLHPQEVIATLRSAFGARGLL